MPASANNRPGWLLAAILIAVVAAIVSVVVVGYAAIPVVAIIGLLVLLGPARPRRSP